MVSSVGGGRNPEQAKELGKATGEDESAMMSSARGDRTPEKQAKDTGEGQGKVLVKSQPESVISTIWLSEIRRIPSIIAL